MSSDPGRERPDTLKVERDGRVAILTLARPQKRNALSDETVLGIERFFDTLDEQIRVVVLDAEGDHFCAGLDLAELGGLDTMTGVFHSRMWHRVFDRIEHGRVPVIAVLRGAVVGGGLELATAAHIRVAERSTFYAFPEGRHGIFVGGGASVRVSRLIGVARMADMMLTGRRYGAEEGATIGLSQYLVPDGEGRGTALELAARVAETPPQTVFAVLQVLPRIAESGRDEGYVMEALAAAITQGTDDAKGRMRDFLEGRGREAGR